MMGSAGHCPGFCGRPGFRDLPKYILAWPPWNLYCGCSRCPQDAHPGSATRPHDSAVLYCRSEAVSDSAMLQAKGGPL